ncbi:MAG TPA: nucleotidyl transferase AbiEii/AbiGii toxin family protein [Gammaproteobacteria bacterium]|nr:nucleotidyl transferase AbiEii/AbiGii toxin family protein [Gammaproteobacteria bacterium]
MKNSIEPMLKKYQCRTETDYINALKEIFQEIALLGLWRSKFFEQAAFYGGTALRILYGLDRFSEDMDFSLLHTDKNFRLYKYNTAIAAEFNAFGFDVEVISKNKNLETTIESAFIKANTIKQLLAIGVPKNITTYIHHMNTIKIKMEIDIDPPKKFSTEVKKLLFPIPFSVLVYDQPDLFAGKLHAILCRQWQNRIKGRDWYDYVWYISRNIPVHLAHLRARLIQSNHWNKSKKLTEKKLKHLLCEKINAIDFKLAKKDVVDFLRDKSTIDIWSRDFFVDLTQTLKTR